MARTRRWEQWHQPGQSGASWGGSEWSYPEPGRSGRSKEPRGWGAPSDSCPWDRDGGRDWQWSQGRHWDGEDSAAVREWSWGRCEEEEEGGDGLALRPLHIEDVPRQLHVWCSGGRWCEFDFASGGVRLHCHLRRPLRLEGSSAAPLLLFLHSASYEPVADLFPEGDAWLDAPELEPAFVLCPRCPDDYYWLLRGNSWEEAGGAWATDARGFCFWTAPAADEMEVALLALLRMVARGAPVDPGRLLLSGASMGGHGCWDLAARRPGLFAALAPVAAHLEGRRARWAAERLQGVPVWAFHGMEDFCCPFEDAAALVRQLGRSASLTVVAGGRGGLSVHNSTGLVAYVEHGPRLLAWMLRQPRREDAIRWLRPPA